MPRLRVLGVPIGPADAGNGTNVGMGERWLSAVSGGGLIAWGVRQRSLPGVLLALSGGALVYRAMTGHCGVYQALGRNTAQPSAAQTPAAGGIKVEQTVTINKTPTEVYTFWRNLENLPQFMTHLESVDMHDNQHSHWVAKAPAGRTVEWDAEVTDDQPGVRLAWRSVAGSDIPNHGQVRFVAAGEGRGTEVHVTLEYAPPAGPIGAWIAKLFGEEPNQQIAEDLRRFKRIMESGEIATTDGQPAGRRSPLGTLISNTLERGKS